MMELTEIELEQIFSWLPYRQDWPVDRNQKDDNIENHYGRLISSLTSGDNFDSYYSEDGGLGNYLEFICYPLGFDQYEGSAILICVSLCSPVAAYGEIKISKTGSSFGWSGLFNPNETGRIFDTQLKEIEFAVRLILGENGLDLIDNEFASRPLPDGVAKNLQFESHNIGEQYLHGLFQKID